MGSFSDGDFRYLVFRYLFILLVCFVCLFVTFGDVSRYLRNVSLYPSPYPRHPSIVLLFIIIRTAAARRKTGRVTRVLFIIIFNVFFSIINFLFPFLFRILKTTSHVYIYIKFNLKLKRLLIQKPGWTKIR